MKLRVITAAMVCAALGLLIARHFMRAAELVAPVTVDLSFTKIADVPIEGRLDLVGDDQLGHRLPRAAQWPVPDGIRRTDDLGLVRDDDLGAEIPGPRILWLASDLLSGVPNADTAPHLVERALRGDGTWTTATVLDATTAGDHLWRLAQRGSLLAARFAPTLVVACVSVDRDVKAPTDQQPPVEDAIARLAALAPRHGGTLLVVLVPDRDLLAVTPDARDAVRGLRRILQGQHVSNVDLTEAFRAADAAALYLEDGRLGAEGHRRVADAVLRRLRRILDSL